MAKITVTGKEGLSAPEANQTSGMSRLQARLRDNVQALRVETPGQTTSGWHHHGDYETYGYVIEGHIRFESGAGGKDVVEAGPGEFFVVPPNTIHREGNPEAAQQRLVGFRVGTGPTLFNVDGPET